MDSTFAKILWMLLKIIIKIGHCLVTINENEKKENDKKKCLRWYVDKELKLSSGGVQSCMFEKSKFAFKIINKLWSVGHVKVSL